MVYRNKLTGAEFSTNCVINAENYEAVSVEETASSVVEEKPKAEKKAPTKKKVTKK